MRNKKALTVLIAHKRILEKDKKDDYYLWQQQALSYIERFLGVDSIEYQRMKSFHFPTYQERDYDQKLSVIRHALLTVIDQCIQTVKNVGIKMEYHNFLCRYSDKELIAGIIAVAGTVFGAGYAVTKFFLVCPNI